jgi:hypothetical protein
MIIAALIILLIIVLLIIFVYSKKTTTSNEIKTNTPAVEYTYFRFSDDLKNNKSIMPMEVFKEVMDSYNIKQGNLNNANIYFFETLNIIDHAIESANFSKNTMFIFGIKGTDDMVSKSSFALFIKNSGYYEIIPTTYIYGIKRDMQELYHDIKTKNKLYILKKNVQRQEGNLISRDPQTVFDGKENGYVVVQEMLLNPYLVNMRKINMRVYLCIIIRNNTDAEFYIYNNGFIYYSPKKWDVSSIHPDVHITTGRFTDRTIYKENPQTFEDLAVYMGHEKYVYLWENIYELMKKVKNVYTDHLTYENKKFLGTKISLYGCDIAPDDTLNVKIMEINKGPDLSYKDTKDKDLKVKMAKDIFQITGIVPNEKDENGFVLL